MSTNIWRQFQDLLPDSPLLIGVIQAVNTDGTATVSILDGGFVRALIPPSGTGFTASVRVFVRGGEITALAPSLAPVTIDIAN